MVEVTVLLKGFSFLDVSGECNQKARVFDAPTEFAKLARRLAG